MKLFPDRSDHEKPLPSLDETPPTAGDEAPPPTAIQFGNKTIYVLPYYRNGAPWFSRRPPFRWHRCRIDSVIEQIAPNGWRGPTARCACGAYRAVGQTEWHGKNSQRKSINRF